MIIDCHYHLEERLLSREELLQRMDEAGVEKAARPCPGSGAVAKRTRFRGGEGPSLLAPVSAGGARTHSPSPLLPRQAALDPCRFRPPRRL
jgi:hypothetical protein